MKRKKRIKNYDEFMNVNFIKCPHCGYNNKKDYFVNYGTCLNCLEILDEKIYFKNTLGIAIRKIRYKEKSL